MSQYPKLAHAIEEEIETHFLLSEIATYYAVMFAHLAGEAQAEEALFALVAVGKLDAFTDYFDADGEEIWTANFNTPVGRGEQAPETEVEADYFEYRFVISERWRDGIRKKVEPRLKQCG